MITVQFVPPGVTQAESSPIFTFGTYHHWPNKTLDRNVSQNHQACLHTVLFNVTKAGYVSIYKLLEASSLLNYGTIRKESVIF